jgi:DNA-binding transcriptional LysR family regulator
MDITLRQIKYFIAAAETGKIAGAASMVNISPSSITESIKELENITGVSLITRHRRGINLTFDGYRFLQHCYNINASVSDAGYFLAPLLARFARTFPHIRVKLFEYPRDKIEEMLMEDKLDLAVLLVSNVNHMNFSTETLVCSKRRLWTSVNHILSSKENITLKDISKEPYIQLMIDEAPTTHMNFWRKYNSTPKIIFRTESIEAVRTMVAVRSGVTILSDAVYRPWSLEGDRIEAHELKDDIPTMDIGLTWSKRRKHSKCALCFIEFCKMEYSSSQTKIKEIKRKTKKSLSS